MPRGLWTTTVGSFPKPPLLEKARQQFARGELTADRLAEMEREETIGVIRRQEAIGLDLLVDGELYRGDMTTYFAELTPGFAISNPVRSYGNRYYRKPIAIGPIESAGIVTVVTKASPGSRSAADENAGLVTSALAITNPPEPDADTVMVEPAATTAPSAGAVI